MIGLLFVVSLFIGACQGDTAMIEHGAAMNVPLHMEFPTGNLQPVMGLSGFIFGIFVLIDAYILILLCTVLLIVKDSTMEKLLMTIRTVLQMLNPSLLESTAMQWTEKLAQNDIRVQYGTIGLISSILLAYFGAWIAL